MTPKKCSHSGEKGGDARPLAYRVGYPGRKANIFSRQSIVYDCARRNKKKSTYYVGGLDR